MIVFDYCSFLTVSITIETRLISLKVIQEFEFKRTLIIRWLIICRLYFQALQRTLGVRKRSALYEQSSLKSVQGFKFHETNSTVIIMHFLAISIP